ncbi:MAG: Hint domain-containing homing endonuclease [Bacillota bacterium]|nr:Hint domain-containing homing endonuclease [Bacillota bacterium]
MDRDFERMQKISAAMPKGRNSMWHDLSQDFDYQLVTEHLGGEKLLRDKYHHLYKILQHTCQVDRANPEGRIKGYGSTGESGFEDSMDIRTLNFDPSTTLQTSSCADLVEPKKTLTIEGSVFDIQTGRCVDGYNVYDHDSSYLMGDTSFPSKELIQERERHFKAQSTFCWIDHDEEGKALLRSKTVQEDAIKIIGSSSIVREIIPYAPIPKNHSEANKVIIYYNRNGADCDYQYENVVDRNGRVEVRMPFSGKVILDNFEPVFVDKNHDFQLYIENKGNGVANFNMSQWNNIKWAVSGHELSWTFPDFWNTTLSRGAFAHALNITFYCRMRVVTKTGISVPLTIQSGNETHRDPSFKDLKFIDIYWGCFAKGTFITMADGTQKEISQITAGDKVIGQRGIRTVKDVVTGQEEKLILIGTSRGKTIRITREHPLESTSGYVKACDLTAATILKMDDGTDSIEGLYETEYHDTVFNLKLDEPDYIIANGYIAGDFDSQNSLRRARYKSAKSLKQEPFQEEITDLFTSLQNEKEARRG